MDRILLWPYWWDNSSGFLYLFWYYKQCCDDYLCNTSWNTGVSLSDKFQKVAFLCQRLCSPWQIFPLCPAWSLNRFRLPSTLRVGPFSHTLNNRVFPDSQSWCGLIILFIKIIHVVRSWAVHKNVEINRTGPKPCPHNPDMPTTILSGKCNNGTRYKGNATKGGVPFIFLRESGVCSQLGETWWRTQYLR